MRQLVPHINRHSTHAVNNVNHKARNKEQAKNLERNDMELLKLLINNRLKDNNLKDTQSNVNYFVQSNPPVQNCFCKQELIS